MLETLPASMAFLCPNVNSYRRFGSQFYVPNAPSWGLDNRTVALRVPTGSPDAVRLEHRVAGADANPYLLLAGACRVHHGLTNKVEPGAPIEGNSYEQLEPSLPNNLRDALRELDDSEIMAKYIDPKYIDIFVACKESELEVRVLDLRPRVQLVPAHRVSMGGRLRSGAAPVPSVEVPTLLKVDGGKPVVSARPLLLCIRKEEIEASIPMSNPPPPQNVNPASQVPQAAAVVGLALPDLR